jgi:hypothetical protein
MGWFDSCGIADIIRHLGKILSIEIRMVLPEEAG